MRDPALQPDASGCLVAVLSHGLPASAVVSSIAGPRDCHAVHTFSQLLMEVTVSFWPTTASSLAALLRQIPALVVPAVFFEINTGLVQVVPPHALAVLPREMTVAPAQDEARSPHPWPPSALSPRVVLLPVPTSHVEHCSYLSRSSYVVRLIAFHSAV